MKIAYNVTTKISHEAAKDWYRWMMDHHINEVMKTDCFESFRFMQLTNIPTEDGHTFSVQYIAKSHQSLKLYTESYADKLRADVDRNFKDQYVSFRTIMNILDEG
ncbi:DUF4286 family protein [Membranihabitans marinus]|uniref:DUF4286 family protein n=1 Tax=Membranihabitans marinus TaxID=1227546 RepID=UPI001F4154C3|nr:DUF4286 family protein [Membranihabitans marinus]